MSYDVGQLPILSMGTISGTIFLRRSWSCERSGSDDGSDTGTGRGDDDVVVALE